MDRLAGGRGVRLPDPVSDRRAAAGTGPPIDSHAVAAAFAQRDRGALIARLDAYVAANLRAAGDPGAALVLADARGVVHCRGFGIDARGAPVTCRTPFAVMSLTKGFTAIAAVALAREGRLRLDAPARTYLPGFRPQDARPITVRELLLMRSGLSTADGLAYLASADAGGDALARRVRALDGARLEGPPGTAYAYSNANYDVVGAILERVSGEPFEQVLRKRVLGPLGIADARCTRGLELRGYGRIFGVPVPARPMPPVRADAPAACLVLDPLQAGRYVSAQLDAGRTWSARTLPPAGWALLHRSPDGSPYALGWTDLLIGGKHVYRHDGMGPDFHAFAVFEPAAGLGAALLVDANEAVDGGRAERFDLGLQRLIVGNAPPDPPPPVAPDLMIRLGVLAGTLASAFAARRELRALRTPARRPRGRRAALVTLGAALLVIVVLWHWPLAAMGSVAVGLLYAPDLTVLLLLTLLAAAVVAGAALRDLIRPQRPAPPYQRERLVAPYRPQS